VGVDFLPQDLPTIRETGRQEDDDQCRQGKTNQKRELRNERTPLEKVRNLAASPLRPLRSSAGDGGISLSTTRAQPPTKYASWFVGWRSLQASADSPASPKRRDSAGMRRAQRERRIPG
jgi:hypothetical protein